MNPHAEIFRLLAELFAVMSRLEVARPPNLSAVSPQGGKQFSPIEEAILAAATDEWQTKTQLAEKTGQAPSSFFSAILSNLAEREWLESSRNGYRLPPRSQP